jgi:hypothetical protein
MSTLPPESVEDHERNVRAAERQWFLDEAAQRALPAVIAFAVAHAMNPAEVASDTMNYVEALWDERERRRLKCGGLL